MQNEVEWLFFLSIEDLRRKLFHISDRSPMNGFLKLENDLRWPLRSELPPLEATSANRLTFFSNLPSTSFGACGMAFGFTAPILFVVLLQVVVRDPSLFPLLPLAVLGQRVCNPFGFPLFFNYALPPIHRSFGLQPSYVPPSSSLRFNCAHRL